MLLDRIGKLAKALLRGSAVLGLALAAQGAVAANAVEVKQIESGSPDIVFVEISGKIERGDAQKVSTFLAGLPKNQQVAVSLTSPGGLIDEALRMGRHFHANNIHTYVAGSGQRCLSACALAFLGGRDASAGTFRVMGEDAKVGFHAFSRDVPDKEFTVADMREAVAGSQRIILTIADYLTAVGADIEFMSLMLETPNAQMGYLSNEKALALGVHLLRQGKLVAPSASPRR